MRSEVIFVKLPKSLTPHSSKDVYTTCELINLNLPVLFPGLISDIMQKFMPLLNRHCSIHLNYRKYFSEHVIMFNNFRGTIYENVVSDVSGNNMCLVLSDICTKHVLCGSMSHDKLCAPTQSTAELPATAELFRETLTVSLLFIAIIYQILQELASLIHLIKIIDIVDDNVNDDNVVNRHGLWGTKII